MTRNIPYDQKIGRVIPPMKSRLKHSACTDCQIYRLRRLLPEHARGQAGELRLPLRAGGEAEESEGNILSVQLLREEPALKQRPCAERSAARCTYSADHTKKGRAKPPLALPSRATTRQQRPPGTAEPGQSRAPTPGMVALA